VTRLLGHVGVAGTLIVEKMVGAETATPLAALKVLGDEVNRRTRSIGVALMLCTVPAAGRPNFTLAKSRRISHALETDTNAQRAGRPSR
jgi:dihydroxyacetone kinase-like protein